MKIKNTTPSLLARLHPYAKHCGQVTMTLTCLALSQPALAVVPSPDGGYPGGNTAEGQAALFGLTSGTYNTAVGFFSLRSNSQGSFNTAIGAGTLLLNTANENTATGVGALLSNTTGPENTANGAFALSRNTVGNSNTAVGSGALLGSVSSSGNTAIGSLALANNDAAGNNLAIFNTAVGALALLSNTDGWDNTAVGDSALASNQTGHSNVAVGDRALYSNVNGSYNTVVGWQAGYHVNGADNIYIGEYAGFGIAAENNTTRIGNYQAHCYIGGIYQEQPDPAANQPVMVAPSGHLVTPVSSARFKQDIKPMENASESILALQPVTFHYKNDARGIPQFGLVAEEVGEVNSDLVVRDRDGKPRSVRYEAVNAMLLNEFLKEHRKVEEQQRKIEKQEAAITELKSTNAQQRSDFEATAAEQQARIQALTASFKEQAAQIQKVSAHLTAATEPATKVAYRPSVAPRLRGEAGNNP